MSDGAVHVPDGVLPMPSRCEACGAPLVRVARARHDPAIGVGVVLAGCFSALYLVGFLLLPTGVWLLLREEEVVACPDCGGR